MSRTRRNVARTLLVCALGFVLQGTSTCRYRSDTHGQASPDGNDGSNGQRSSAAVPVWIWTAPTLPPTPVVLRPGS